MPETAALADSDLDDAAWDLDPLVENDGEEGVKRQLTEAAERAEHFAQRYQGNVREFDSAALAEAMTELAGISELVGRAGTYASLRFSTDTADPERGALMQKVSERATDLQTKLFFELEWASLCDDHAESLLADERLDF